MMPEQALVVVAESAVGLLVVDGDDTAHHVLDEHRHARERSNRRIELDPFEALVPLGVIDDERFLVDVHPPQQCVCKVKRRGSRPGVLDAQAGLHGICVLSLVVQHGDDRLLRVQRSHQTVDQRLHDIVGIGLRAHRKGEFRQDGQLLHRSLEPGDLLLERLGIVATAEWIAEFDHRPSYYPTWVVHGQRKRGRSRAPFRWGPRYRAGSCAALRS